MRQPEFSLFFWRLFRKCQNDEKRNEAMSGIERLPVAVVGGGPVGLAAAAHLIAQGLPVTLFEAGPDVGTSLRDWGHVRLFSPWRYNVDKAAPVLLQRHGWRAPSPDHLPTGNELYSEYLRPLAGIAEMGAVIETNVRITAISRCGIDKVVSTEREKRPFELIISGKNGAKRVFARAVIDASGTWSQPNPLGANGLRAEGEAEFGDRIAYGIPDVLGRHRTTYAGRRTLVVGAGHSAADALLDLVALAKEVPRTSVIWSTRSTNLARVFGGEEDQLPARAELGAEVKRLAESGRVELVAGLAIAGLSLRRRAIAQ
jgi:cation diffusion facilitator CzcD-associated flavoprotein CzcO